MHLNVYNLFKHLTVFVLVFGTCLHSAIAENQCISLFQSETKLEPSDLTKTHILKGEFSPEGKLDGGMHTIDAFFKLFELNTNLHIALENRNNTELSELVDLAKSIYPRDLSRGYLYARFRTLPNGVVLVELPQSVFSRRAQILPLGLYLGSSDSTNLKCLFPLSWTKEFILETVKQIAATASREDIFVKKGIRQTVRGVTVTVRFDDKGQIKTAYPSLNQPSAQEVKNFTERQKRIIGEHFIKKIVAEMDQQVEELLRPEAVASKVSFNDIKWLELISPELRKNVFGKMRRQWLIDDPQAIREGLQQGFADSPLAQANLERNLGALTFRQRLIKDRETLPENQIKQRSRFLLIRFGVTAPTEMDIENVSQILRGRAMIFSADLQAKLNQAAQKSLDLFFRAPANGESPTTDAFEDAAKYNWFSIFFTDVRTEH